MISCIGACDAWSLPVFFPPHRRCHRRRHRAIIIIPMKHCESIHAELRCCCTLKIYAHLVYLQTSAANPRQNQFLFPLGVFKNIFLRDKPSHLATILLPFELCSLFKMGLRGSLGSNLSRAAIQNRKIDEYPMCNRHDAT